MDEVERNTANLRKAGNLAALTPHQSPSVTASPQGEAQQQLSEQLQLKGIYVCRGSISRIENGSRIVTDFELGAIAEILGVTPSVFFGLEDKNPKD